MKVLFILILFILTKCFISFITNECEDKQENILNNKNNLQKPRFLSFDRKIYNKDNSKNIVRIFNLLEYLKENKNRYANKSNIIEIKDKGQCMRSFELDNIYVNNSEILNNLKNLKNFLSERIFIYSDEFSNLLIFSPAQTNKENKTNDNKILFISEIDFNFYEFKLRGEQLPILSKYSIDFVNETTGYKKYIYLHGGVLTSGKQNSFLYKIEINYLCGHATSSKFSSESANRKSPIGISESSLNIIQFSNQNELYKFNKNNHNRHLIIIYGGVKDHLYSNELWSYNTELDHWQNIDLKNPSINSLRKGHSSVLVPSFGSEDADLNKDLLRNFYLFIFGGKTNFGYLNDLMIIKITYMTIDNSFDYKIITPEIQGSIYPEPREGHQALVKDDYMYIIGGCNHEIPKCYDDLYRINYKNIPMQWKKINFKLKDNEHLDQNNLNFMEFKGELISYGNTANGSLNPKLNLFLEKFNCECDKAFLFTDDTGITHAECEKEKFEVSPSLNEIKLNNNNNIESNPNVNKIENITDTTPLVLNTTRSDKNSTAVASPVNLDNYIYHDIKHLHNRGKFKERNHLRNRNSTFHHYSKQIIDEDQLKKMISSIIETSINPLIKENESIKKVMTSKLKFREQSSDFEEKIKSNTRDIKNLIQTSLRNNLLETRNLSRNLTNIRSSVERFSKNSNDEIKSSLNILMKNFEEFNKTTTEKLNRLERESIEFNKEISINKLNNKCIYGYLINNTNCLCFPGYKGINCESPLKCENDCYGNGECRFGKCFCKQGYEGDLCNKSLTCKNDCNSKGKCLLGKCLCEENYSGDDCSLELLCKNSCNNHGICFRGDCLCEPGYYGDDCSNLAYNFKPCGDNNCNGNGLCKYEKCFCYPGYTGINCEIKNEFMCPPYPDYKNNQNNDENNNAQTWLPCNGNGLCKYGKCFCYPGFKGDDCSYLEKCPNNCSGNGLCIKGKCICHDESKNSDCSKDKKDLNSNNDKISFKNLHFREIEPSEAKIDEKNTNYQKTQYNFINYSLVVVPIFIILLSFLIFSKSD